MTMLDEQTLRKAFRTRLQTVSNLPDFNSRIAWVGHDFVPPSLQGNSNESVPLWIEEEPQIIGETHSSTGNTETIGVYFWNVHTPSGKGTEAADAVCKSIAEAFQASQSLIADSVAFSLVRAERRPYRANPRHPAWMFKSVAITWRNFTPV
jgi:hypothetical protein